MPHDNYHIRVHTPNTVIWDEIKEDVLEIERHHFGRKAYSQQDFKEYFSNPNSVIALIIDNVSTKAVGYLFALPAFEAYADHEDNFHPDRQIRNRHRLDRTAYLEAIAIHKDHLGKGLSSRLIKTLEDELWKQGYRFLELDAVVHNNFAASLARKYADHIIEQEGPTKSYYGPRMYFSIRLEGKTAS